MAGFIKLEVEENIYDIIAVDHIVIIQNKFEDEIVWNPERQLYVDTNKKREIVAFELNNRTVTYAIPLSTVVEMIARAQELAAKYNIFIPVSEEMVSDFEAVEEKGSGPSCPY